MELVNLIAILLFTFGTLTFAMMTHSWWTEYRMGSQEVSLEHGVIGAFSTLWFALNLVVTVLGFYRPETGRSAGLLIWAMAILWPPLIMQLHLAEWRHGPVPLRWRIPVWCGYSVAVPLSLPPVLFYFELMPGWVLFHVQMVFVTSFIAVSIYSIAFGRANSRQVDQSPAEKTSASWNILLWSFAIVVMLSFLIEGEPRSISIVFSLIAPSFPLIFVFVNTYYLERFTFLEVFVKRGFFALLTLLLLALVFKTIGAWVPPAFSAQEPWLVALLVLPVALALPWIYRQMESWIDRRLLGRRFDSLGAVKHFLGGIQKATSEADLVDQSRQRLEEIFQANTHVIMGSTKNDPRIQSAALAVPIGSGEQVKGAIAMGKRSTKMPFFAKDIALVTSLADVLSYSMENLRLQTKKQDQEQREKELMIHASRSELKALRAQINPHFLFNALNAIASLIHEDPDHAEETVEQLAEVFRYTLKDSDQEWARLEDEIDFVRAYLEVEKSRFGKRLTVEIETDESLRDVHIPTMVVQTLVENSVKHGIMRSRGPGLIRVSTDQLGNQVRIQVSDSGPGLGNSSSEDGLPARRKGTGFGLRSVRDRLQGYFEGRAELHLGRDEQRGHTVATITIPKRMKSQMKRAESA